MSLDQQSKSVNEDMPFGEMSFEDQQAKIEEMQTRFGGKWRELCLDIINTPSADALDKLWRDIILKRDPTYGTWDYPGQAYRHLMAEFEDLAAERDRLRELLEQIRNGDPEVENMPLWKEVMP